MTSLEGGWARAEGAGARSLARTLLIVPAAHYRVLDEHFQAEMYELFHRRAGCRIGHMLCTPVVVLGLLLALGSVASPGWSWPLPLALGALVVAWGARVDRLAGAAMVPLVALALLAARGLAGVCAEPASLGAALAVGGAALQTFSHGFEDIPPPLSGRAGWVPMRAWLGVAPPARVAGSVALMLVVFVWLELWASPRVWPLQVLHVLLRGGRRPDLRARLAARVDEIVANPEREWREPLPPLTALPGRDSVRAPCPSTFASRSP